MSTVRRICTICIGLSILFYVSSACADNENLSDLAAHLSAQIDTRNSQLSSKVTKLDAVNSRIDKYSLRVAQVAAALAVANSSVPDMAKEAAIEQYLLRFHSDDYTAGTAKDLAQNHTLFLSDYKKKKGKWENRLQGLVQERDAIAQEVEDLKMEIAVLEQKLAEQRQIDEEYFKDPFGFRIKRNEEWLERVRNWEPRDYEYEKEIEEKIRRLKEMQKEEALNRGQEIQRQLNEAEQRRQEDEERRRGQHSREGTHGPGRAGIPPIPSWPGSETEGGGCGD